MQFTFLLQTGRDSPHSAVGDLRDRRPATPEVRALEPNEISLGCVVDACVSNANPPNREKVV